MPVPTAQVPPVGGPFFSFCATLLSCNSTKIQAGLETGQATFLKLSQTRSFSVSLLLHRPRCGKHPLQAFSGATAREKRRTCHRLPPQTHHIKSPAAAVVAGKTKGATPMEKQNPQFHHSSDCEWRQTGPKLLSKNLVHLLHSQARGLCTCKVNSPSHTSRNCCSLSSPNTKRKRCFPL